MRQYHRQKQYIRTNYRIGGKYIQQHRTYTGRRKGPGQIRDNW